MRRQTPLMGGLHQVDEGSQGCLCVLPLSHAAIPAGAVPTEAPTAPGGRADLSRAARVG